MYSNKIGKQLDDDGALEEIDVKLFLSTLKPQQVGPQAAIQWIGHP